jgi:hypothetical protein
MAFITHCWKSALCRLDRTVRATRAWRGLCGALVLGLAASWAQAAGPTVELQSLRMQRGEDQWLVSAVWQFDLPSSLEDALQKGVPLYFVTEAEVTRERWYFYDKRIAHVERHVRLAFMPLTMRWRLSVSSQPFSSGGSGMSLAQNFDSFAEAMDAVRRVAQWPIAPVADIDADAKHNLELRFKLDLTQLPRPLQIGMAGQTDWNLSWSRTVRLQADNR